MSQSKADYINAIGAGLAGSQEAAYQIAKRGIPVKLYEMHWGQKQHLSIRQQTLQNWFALTLCDNWQML